MTPATMMGSPPGSTWVRTYATTPDATATASSTRVRSSGTSRARNASGKTRSTPSRSGSGIARAEERSDERRGVPRHEEAQLGAEQELERPLASSGNDAVCLVGQEVRGRGPPPAGQWNAPAERQPVEDVADVQQERREDDLDRCGACPEQPRRAHLRAPGEHERGERLGLEDGESGVARDHGIGDAERRDSEPERHHRREPGRKRTTQASDRPHLAILGGVVRGTVTGRPRRGEGGQMLRRLGWSALGCCRRVGDVVVLAVERIERVLRLVGPCVDRAPSTCRRSSRRQRRPPCRFRCRSSHRGRRRRSSSRP